ncbi:hypothetical protein [Tenacibaculum sp. IB213877]|uniref:hypothetical protein n=1 Tax=Tenacibaculum sp. IB213877 TaxID=3097351 RepID=UPI002A5A4510|nr:hypothetical protein [Tenacibaculum sp. IB213877]MDY0781680.1 hypothetical protein [Tenacibaculum sp. IB213877]
MIENYIWISNHEINKEDKTSIDNFLKKVNHLKGLRTRPNLRFTFYPVSKNEVNNNLKIWDYINKNKNSLNDEYYIFNLGLPENMLNFLKFSKRTKLLNPIILGIATKYVLDYDKREIMREQVYEPIFDKALNLVDKYFSDFLISSEFHEKYCYDFPEYYNTKLKSQFDKAFKEYVGDSSILPFICPWKNNKKYDTTIFETGEFDLKIPIAYMTKKDWEVVVITGEKDTLERAESRADVFNMWKYDLPNNHVGLEI